MHSHPISAARPTPHPWRKLACFQERQGDPRTQTAFSLQTDLDGWCGERRWTWSGHLEEHLGPEPCCKMILAEEASRGAAGVGGWVGTANTEARAEPLPQSPPPSPQPLPQLLPAQPRPAASSPGPWCPEHLPFVPWCLRAESPWVPACGAALVGNRQVSPSQQ